MKRSALIKILCLIVLVLGLAFSTNTDAISDLDYTISSGYDFFQLEFKGIQLTPNQSTPIYMYNIAGFDSINFYVGEILTGNITTISIQPMLSDKIEIGTAQVLESGTDITDFKSGHYKFTILNPKAATNNITMNILLAK